MKDNFVHTDLHPGNVLVTFARPASTFNRSLTDFLSPSILDVLKSSPDRLSSHLESFKAQNYHPVVVMLDVGLTSSLTDRNLKNLQDILKAGINFDGQEIGKIIITRNKRPQDVIYPDLATSSMSSLFHSIKLDTQGRLSLKNVYSSEIIRNFMEYLRKYHIRMEADFIGLCISSILMEGIGRKLDADLDLVEHVSNYVT